MMRQQYTLCAVPAVQAVQRETVLHPHHHGENCGVFKGHVAQECTVQKSWWCSHHNCFVKPPQASTK